MHRAALGSILLLAAAGPALAGPRKQLEVADLKRVEAQVADMNPLSPEGRVMPAQLEVPVGFNGVYKVPEDADTPVAGWVARVSGAVIAVFPASEYRWHKKAGIYPVAPTQTMFMLGGIPLRDQPDESRAVAPLVTPLETGVSLGISDRVDSMVRPTPGGARADARWPSRPTPPIADARPLPQKQVERLALDEAYRAARVTELLRRAEAP